MGAWGARHAMPHMWKLKDNFGGGCSFHCYPRGYTPTSGTFMWLLAGTQILTIVTELRLALSSSSTHLCLPSPRIFKYSLIQYQWRAMIYLGGCYKVASSFASSPFPSWHHWSLYCSTVVSPLECLAPFRRHTIHCHPWSSSMHLRSRHIFPSIHPSIQSSIHPSIQSYIHPSLIYLLTYRQGLIM